MERVRPALGGAAGTAATRRRSDDALAGVLCTACALCCDGTLLGDVELTGPAEAARLELLGLDVDTDDADMELLSLPCAGLRGTRCSIYPQRPRCCRTFECRLLHDARRGAVSIDEALARIAAAKQQVRTVEGILARMPAPPGVLPLAERISDAVDAERGESVSSVRRRRALEAASDELGRTLRATFLDG